MKYRKKQEDITKKEKMHFKLLLSGGDNKMDFIDELKQFSSQVSKIKDSLQTEEATKMSLILPFFQLLGYNVFDPKQFVPEYTTAYGTKKDSRVDYAIMRKGTPVIFVEAKACNEPLDRHSSQLFQYFNATPSTKFGILTNGILYKFYTDLDKSNLMDETPFLEIDMLNIKDNQVQHIKRFSRSQFDAEAIFSTAAELKYISQFRTYFNSELSDPSDGFVRFFLQESQVYTGVKSTNIVNKFKPILKQALNGYISELMNDKIQAALKQTNEANKLEEEVPEKPEEMVVPDTDPSVEEKTTKSGIKIITTDNEIKAFNFVRDVLIYHGKDVDKLLYKDTTVYFGVFLKHSGNWILRMQLGSDSLKLITPFEIEQLKELVPGFEVETAPKGIGNSRLVIHELEDIKRLGSLIVACYDLVSKNL